MPVRNAKLARAVRLAPHDHAARNALGLALGASGRHAEALERCSTDDAPWFVVPADRKWYRDWAVANLVRETFAGMGLQYPKATFDVKSERARLTADERKKNAP